MLLLMYSLMLRRIEMVIIKLFIPFERALSLSMLVLLLITFALAEVQNPTPTSPKISLIDSEDFLSAMT